MTGESHPPGRAWTAAERRLRRRARLVARHTTEASRLAYEMREVKDGYRRAADLYIRRLEKLLARATTILRGQQELSRRVAADVARELAGE